MHLKYSRERTGARRRTRMNRLRLTFLSAFVLSTACVDITQRGIPCGGTRRVDAQAVLPDTGLGAGGQATVSFFESEPRGTLDETALAVSTFPPTNTMFADNPPRVRLVVDDGSVLLDGQSTSAYLGSWFVKEAIPTDAIREKIVSAFSAGLVMVEYSTGHPAVKVTRVRPIVRFAGRDEVFRCL